MKKLLRDRRRHLPVLFILLGAVLFVNLFSSTAYRSFSVTLNVGLKLGRPGETRLVLTPIGQVKAKTHWLPARFTVALESVDLALLRKVVFSPPQMSEELLTEFQVMAQRLLLLFFLKTLFLGAGGAFFALWLLGVRRTSALLKGGLAGFLAVLVILGSLYFSYDLTAFSQPEYEGMIEAAPWVLNTVWEAVERVEELGERVRVLAVNLYSALNQLETLGPVGLVEADLVVLHVSDIHNNPVAYDFARQVVESFPVDFVLDTGDLTDWGTALEAEITLRIAELAVPYIFVSGNHESPEVLERLDTLENVFVIGEEILSLHGLRIGGTGDPAAKRVLPEPAPLRELAEIAEEINETWAARKHRPDIFMVHNHRIAEALQAGLFPVVVYGHTHVQKIEQIDGTVYINAGTTGAAGIRGFQGKEPLPYSLSLLYFARDNLDQPVLIAVDGVHVAGLGQSFSLQRTFVERRRNPPEDVETITENPAFGW